MKRTDSQSALRGGQESACVSGEGLKVLAYCCLKDEFEKRENVEVQCRVLCTYSNSEGNPPK